MSLQPNSRHCFVCGLANPFGLQLRFFDAAPGEVRAEYTVPVQYQGYPGVVHGGIVAAILDELTGRALMSGGTLRFMFTARLDVRYRQNVPIETPLQLAGKVVKERGRTATARGEIYSPEGVLLAEAEALLVDVPADMVELSDLERLGWKVYPMDAEVLTDINQADFSAWSHNDH